MSLSLVCCAILGDVQAFPFLDDLLGLWGKFSGRRSSMRKTIRTFGDPVMEKIRIAGIPVRIGIHIFDP